MRHLFIPFELARLAKEKGFNEPCLRYFNERDPEPVSWAKNEKTTNSGLAETLHHGWVTLPLYQQIVDWFREVHKLIIWFDPKQLKWAVFNPKTQGSFYPASGAIDKVIEECFKLIGNPK